LRVLHFDCFSGISGDMGSARCSMRCRFLGRARPASIRPRVAHSLVADKVQKGGFAATQAVIEAPGEKSHRFLPDVEAIFNKGALPPRSELAMRIFRRLAEAEAAAHGNAVDRVTFSRSRCARQYRRHRRHGPIALDSLLSSGSRVVGADGAGDGEVCHGRCRFLRRHGSAAEACRWRRATSRVS